MLHPALERNIFDKWPQFFFELSTHPFLFAFSAIWKAGFRHIVLHWLLQCLQQVHVLTYRLQFPALNSFLVNWFSFFFFSYSTQAFISQSLVAPTDRPLPLSSINSPIITPLLSLITCISWKMLGTEVHWCLRWLCLNFRKTGELFVPLSSAMWRHIWTCCSDIWTFPFTQSTVAFLGSKYCVLLALFAKLLNGPPDCVSRKFLGAVC